MTKTSCICPRECDCESPNTSPSLISNHCPEHNWSLAGFQSPDPLSECPALVHHWEEESLPTPSLRWISINGPLPLKSGQWYRASGHAICSLCGKDYYSHPYDFDFLDRDGNVIDHVLCNGDVVHL